MRIIVATLFALSCVAVAANGQDPGCERNPALTGKCYWVRGTIGISADDADALWRDGGGSALVPRDAPESKKGYPASLEKALSDAFKRGKPLKGIHGRFKVCPIPREQPDKYGLDYVCIQAAKRLSVVWSK